MNAAGNCHENAKAEAFFSTLKRECFHERQVFGTKAELVANLRIHSRPITTIRVYTARWVTRRPFIMKQSLAE
jgi:transposase InsO family protein